MRVATAIAKTLEAAGTRYCFGYNGHGNWALLDAFVHETSITTIATRAEDQAVHMADCYWRTLRKPPMAVVTTSGARETLILRRRLHPRSSILPRSWCWPRRRNALVRPGRDRGILQVRARGMAPHSQANHQGIIRGQSAGHGAGFPGAGL